MDEEEKFEIKKRINDVDIVSCIKEDNFLRCEIHKKDDGKDIVIKDELTKLSFSGDVNGGLQSNGRITVVPSKHYNFSCLKFGDEELDCHQEK